MTDRFALHTTLIAAGQAGVKLAHLVIAVALVRLLDPAQWNDVALLLTIYVAGVTIGTLNLHHGIAYFLPRLAPEQHRPLVLRAMTAVVGLGVVAAVGLTIAGALSDRPGATDRYGWLGVSIALELPSSCVATTLITLKRFALVAVWDLAGTCMLIGASISPVALGSGPGGVVAGLVAVGLLRLVIGTSILRTLLPKGSRSAGVGSSDLLRYGLPLGLTLTVSILNRMVDKWFVALFRPADFGVYVIAAQEVPLLSVLPYAGGAALLTALVDAYQRDDIAVARTHWLHLTTRMSTVVVPLGVATALVAPELLAMVFAGELSGAVLPFQLFSIVAIHRVAEFGMLLRAAGRTGDVVKIAAFTLLANTALAGLGAFGWGMLGASVGTAIATLLGWLVAMRHIARALDVTIRESFAWATWSACVATAAGAAVVGDRVAHLTAVHVSDSIQVVFAVKVVGFAGSFLLARRWWRASRFSAGPAARFVPERTADTADSAMGV